MILRNCIIIQITEIVPIILLVRLEVMFGIRCYAASSEYMLLQLLVIKKINYSSKYGIIQLFIIICLIRKFNGQIIFQIKIIIPLNQI